MSKEIEQIIQKINSLAPGTTAILATVVDLEGSGYRRPGARMLIDENGKSIGTVSGGCLEADVLERAKKVLRTGDPTVITYDTTKDENSPFGLGMGCRGVVRILLEPIRKESDFFKFVSACLSARESCQMTTLIEPKNSDLKIGARLFQDKKKFFSKDFSADEIAEARNLSEKPVIADLSFGKVFIETINPPLNLLLFGAGYDAIPFAKFAKDLGWRVTLIDHRATWANAERFPEADEILVSRPENLPESLFAYDETAVAVVMTHNYEADRKILSRLLSSDCRYVGALGPKKRTEKILAELAGEGVSFTPAELEKLYAPVGLDIGADTPETIALSIIAEIQSVLSGREGGFLRLRQGGIYDRASR
jgi:xanthine dehydrogenase accessory factor